jgi:hypothetical protein
MNVLEKILEEIEDHAIEFESFGMCDDYVSVGWAKEIIRSHMDDVPKCGECSRRKWYQIGYEDGKKNDGWIPVEDKLPEEKGWYQCTCSDKEIWNDDIVRDLYYYPEIKEFVDNIRYEANGLKDIEKYYWTKYVTAWQPLPEPYKEG